VLLFLPLAQLLACVHFGYEGDQYISERVLIEEGLNLLVADMHSRTVSVSEDLYLNFARIAPNFEAKTPCPLLWLFI
jgi:hypothetical protein